jgi:3-hydroxybutyryl-CoA dehydratase
MLKDAQPGHTLPSIEKTIDQHRIGSWAGLTGDFNRLHVDPEYAANTRFKGTIAHGHMSIAFLNELMMACFGEAWAAGGRLLDIRFVAPIRPGDLIRIGGTVKEILDIEGENWAQCDLFIEKENGEKAVLGRGISRLSGGDDG